MPRLCHAPARLLRLVMGGRRSSHRLGWIRASIRGPSCSPFDHPLSLISFHNLQILQSIAFVFILFFLSTIPTLPLSVYQTFVLEEKHGFNKTTPSLFVIDFFKSWALSLVLGAPFLAAFLFVFKWAGDRFVPWLMGFM